MTIRKVADEVLVAQQKLEQMRREWGIVPHASTDSVPVVTEPASHIDEGKGTNLPVSDAAEVFGEVIESKDIAYVHSLFLQCFLPLRHTAKNREIWQVGNGRATLAITAGYGVDPANRGKLKKYETPAGSMGNLVVAYTFDFIRRQKTPVVDLGDSLRDCMERLEIPIGGKNGKVLEREVLNFANADILFGLWKDGQARQKKTPVTESLSFWLDKDEQQRTLWRKEMEVSAKLYEAVMDGSHCAPVYLPAYAALRQSPLAQNIFALWSYRLWKPLNRPAIIPATVLHSIFGQDYQELRKFWPAFKVAAAKAHNEYREARVSFIGEQGHPATWAMKLESSPPRIPHQKLHPITSPAPESPPEAPLCKSL